MVKARSDQPDGVQVFMFGLSAGNMSLLLEGKPIKINLSEMGGPANIEVVILGGMTEERIVVSMKAAGWKLPEGV